ncbi:class I SAM-dependent methyltransferase [Nocardioides massiliensis]|uniref:SAM-dependent methyltransferase n=1 Tax=Nocardioides massiliensis TaxID=1325935 RepID=A0ABT9NTC5_9ACTN|nr:class I SAM-dependent methyltransferase [Nocardioides massiliensis]MDP9823454.1 SAM-dependent methyltransferase [Nocardioides massiliensis]
MPGSVTSPATRWAATLGRSVRLFRDFRVEQSDPGRFYGALARDSVGQVTRYTRLDGAVMLDVGGGPGYFHEAFQRAGATYFSLDADVGELSGLGEILPGTVVGSGMQLPFADDSFDLCYSSNVLEHVAEPWRMAEEMLRVTRPGGLVFISYTVWFGPWGGHETSPWHYLGGARARARYRRRHGHDPKNKYGESLFAVTTAEGLRWARTQQAAEVVATVPRYHPAWATWVLRVPVLREVVTWNLALVLRKR